jgi:glycosyltransferase involved in cell wall biosynthesis
MKEMIVCLIPIYQGEATFSKSADSLLSLDPQPDLYVFCENNPTDNSLKLISEFEAKKEIIRLWFRQDVPEVLGGF